MADLDYSFTNTELITEVRDSMAGLSATKVPDDTITQTADRFVVPLLNDITGSLNANDDQDAFDNAVIALTAEKAFGAWLTFTRLRDREVETYIDPEQYISQLKERTNDALRILGTSRPPEIPNKVVTIKHDGEKRKVDFSNNWTVP